MIRIVKPDFKRSCNCCFSIEKVQEIEFKSVGRDTVVALCQKCMKELKDEIERHGDLRAERDTFQAIKRKQEERC